VILESLAYGTPVAVAPVAGVRAVVRNDETGFLLSEYHPESIAELIGDCLNYDNFGRIGTTGRDLTELTYGFEEITDRY